MMARDHDRIEELLAVRVLDALDGDDVAALAGEMSEHEPDCAECRRLEAELNEVAAMLAFALDPQPVDPSMPERILSEAMTVPEAQVASADDVAADRSAARDQLAERRTHRRGRGWTALVAAAVAAALVVGGTVFLLPRRTESVTTNWAQTVVRFRGQNGELAMAYEPGETGAVFWGRGLPDPGPGKTLEIWMFRGDTPISSGCVTTTDGRVAAFEPVDLSSAELMAVTVESAKCPSAPTSQPILTAPLTLA